MHDSLQFSGPFLCWNVLLCTPITLIWDALGIHFVTPGYHFGTWRQPGGPWEQQEGHRVIQNRIPTDFCLGHEKRALSYQLDDH